jgi:cysteine desulfurase
MTKGIYLDNNATTRVDPRVVEAMLPFFTEQFGNGSSIHSFGSAVGAAILAARKQVQALLGAEFDHEIIFTAGGTESNNTVLLSALETQVGRTEIITSTVEHPAILNLCAWLEQSRGVKVHRIPVDSFGRLDIAAYRDALSDRTALVSFMWANNETGALFPILLLAEMAHEAGALFHTDAVQAAGKVPIEVAGTAIDFLSLSGHKFHGPKGTGALYVKRGVKLKPLLRGGHQERGRRAGTENAPGLIGLGKAAELALASLQADALHISALRDTLQAGLLAAIPNAIVTGDPLERLPNTTTIAFEYVEGEAILLLLNREGIAASSGSACTSGSLEPSHVMRAMGVPYTAAHGATRFSLSRETTRDEIEHVIDVMPGIIAKLRKMSPYWDSKASRPVDFQPAYA